MVMLAESEREESPYANFLVLNPSSQAPTPGIRTAH